MANEQNLRPVKTKEEARERGRNGGIKSGEAKRRKKQENQTIKETVKAVLNTPVTDRRQLDVIKKSGMPIPEKPVYRDFLIASAVMRDIQKGNVDTLMKYAAIMGENSQDEQRENGMLADLIDGLKDGE